ncbi:LpqN/LpqT family lipoprotein [Mycolicibacterium smegmatis]|uniref:LpqN/LpqT family lipoprotein n=1 Tax=Mycolicibacterium smegmatis TaxID=1772 RepID=UPI0020A54087|nr:LpqN/LpqT family lipoprotein [Mycolicibacterium smegmatis]MCP2624720.1 LpqN/LpqT family lipoprotein [Mycolicibacterium smegmatis]
MITTFRSGGAVLAACALATALSACGSDVTAGQATTGDQTTSATSTAAQTSAKAAPEPIAEGTSGPHYTIVDYIRDNGITEMPVHRGDPGTPVLDIPIPPGWADAGADTPEWAWSAMVSTDPAFADDPPMIIALMSRLTGDVDPAKILEYAPNEIKNLPGYDGEGSEGTADELSGFDAYQIGGMYVRDGQQRLIAQKTVVIPGQDGLYVLQLNADGTEDQLGTLLDATSVIDEKTVITP